MPPTKNASKKEKAITLKQWINYLVILFVLVSVGVGIYIYWWTAPSLQEVLAEEFNISPTEALFVNVPPGSLRLPGTIITASDILLDGIDTDDARLLFGSAHSFSKDFNGSVYGSSITAKNKLWQILTDSQTGWEFKVRVDKGQVIEIDNIVDRIKETPFYPSIEAGEKLLIVSRAFKGDITIVATTNKKIEGQGAVGLETLKATADSLSTSISIAENDSIAWHFEDVYAFVAMDPGILAGVFPGGTPAGETSPFADATPLEADPDSVAQLLLKFDPMALPNLDITLREAGPDVGKAIVKRTVEGDSTERVRGAELMMAIPRNYRIQVDSPQSSLEQGDATERAWSVLQLLDEPASDRAASLKTALADDNQAIRYLAARSIGDLGAGGSDLNQALSQATRDQDKAVQEAAERSLVRVTAQPGRELSAANTAVRSGERSAQIAAVDLIGTPSADQLDESLQVLERALASPHASVKLKALRKVSEMGQDATPLKSSVQALTNDPDRNVALLARKILKDLE